MKSLYLLLIVLLLPSWGCADDSPKKTEVELKTNVPYREKLNDKDDRNVLDIYIPAGKKDYPILFFVHGGTWSIGGKGYFAQPARRLAEAGIGVVSTNYRLSPANKHPAHIEDVAKAFAWTVDNIKKYGGDPKKIVLAGHSAGGHLVSLLASNEKYLKAEKKSFADIRGVVGVSGVYIIDHRVELFHPIFGKEAEVCKQASPLTHAEQTLPPFCLIYGDDDLPSLGEQAEIFNKALAKSKNQSVAKEFNKRNHITILTDMRKADDPALIMMKDFIEKNTTIKEEK